MKRALAVALALAGCKTPSLHDGALVCGGGGECPQGWHCAADRTCWRNGADPLLDMAIADLAPGGGGGDDLVVVGADLAPRCGWSLSPTNFDPCTIPSSSGDWIAINGTYDTDAAMGANGPVGTVVQQTGGPLVRLVHVGQFSVPPGISLSLSGGMPLVIVADNVDVSGSIYVGCGNGGGACSNVVNGVTGGRCGSGAAGGAFGAAAGGGGTCSGTIAPGSPAAIGNVELAPLIGGCSGGHGGGPGGTTVGSAGGAGGALQIAARLALNVSGVINAGGSPGGGGAGNLASCGGSVGCAAGGGGGGSGGAILLEGPTVIVDGKLCANGGGGGGGAGNGNGSAAGTGGPGTCADIAAVGGFALGSGGNGQAGGHASHPAGVDGANSSVIDGGGGGGGSVGRIRVHARNAKPISITAVVTPVPYLN